MDTVHGLTSILGNVICTCGRLLKQAVNISTGQNFVCMHPRLFTSILTIIESVTALIFGLTASDAVV